MKYEPLEWDSDFFGFPVARLVSGGAESLEEALQLADANGVRCLYFLCPSEDLPLLHRALDAGFRPYDIRLELSADLGRASASPQDVREATADDTPTLETLAAERLLGSRFWSDPRFPRDRVRDLYVAWMRRGLSTAPLRKTIVAGEVEGFVTCRFEQEGEVGVIELIAVSPAQEGKGVGDALVQGAGQAFLEAGLKKSEVVTQGSNIAAQRLYQRSGYRTARVGLWLHRWAGPGL